ncbi:diaminopimelate decarboxylase [Petroclostridium xylanilyticum]|jgi:diaminopimelate decarboxylase|uniref:diaminopimelate decarboxylase n=1 Tax=Petroclostridium xylanilyticum TaxID=1792311 RepID=UPI000B981CA3|nr:diaminopimelate decarboxylase [Petroclostridium xylanilyticum]
MFVSECLKVNKLNHLEIGGCDAVELAKEYGTPLYIMDEGLIRKYCKIYKNSMDKYYDGNGLVLYASKAFCTLYMCKIAEQEGLGLDVVSGGELYTALKAKFPVEKIYFHGNNKTYDELQLAVENNVGRIVVDNTFELEILNEIAAKMNKKVKILFRIKPGIDAHTHDFIRTGQIDSKFGVALETGEALDIVEHALRLANVEVIGLHCHIGSQIFDLAPFELAAKVMMNFIGDLKDKFGLEIKELNLGGGYGIKYIPEHDPIEYDSYIEAVSKVVKQVARERGVQLPFILMEPGRSIVGPAGITVYTVGAVKRIPNVRKYVSVDGGMADNPRYILYQSPYDAVLANNPTAEKVEPVTIAGKCCESGDLLIKDIMMPPIKPGDYLAVLATGAYNYSMASNYNRIPRPPVVMVHDGKAKLIVKRETYEDIVQNDILD